MSGERLCIYVRNISRPATETGHHSHVNGITVNKTTQTVESASGAFHIEDVFPLIDGGRFPVKRIVGERVEVWADIYRDGHDVVAAALVWRREQDREWRRAPMTHHSNDRWGGSFVPDAPGRYVYAIEAWTDEFATWRHGFELKQKAGADLTLDAIEGAGLLTKAQAGGQDAAAVILRQCEEFLQTGEAAPLLTDELKTAMAESQLRPDLTRSQLFPFVADRPRARHGAWYEMVPRSQGVHPGQHGTFQDCIARLPDIAAMGFDVVYLTPIHPIGQTNRKGRNNAVTAAEGDPGSPYAIGSADGGHDAVHPELGTLEDFRALRRGVQDAQHGSRARYRRAVFARPSLAQGPSAMVQETAGRIDALCGEPAEEIRRHRQSRFCLRGRRRAVECACATSFCSGSIRASASSGSTIPTPSRSGSGNG